MIVFPIKEKPYKLVCENCGFSKIIVPKRRDHSDIWAAKRLYKATKDSTKESISDADSKEKEAINLDKILDCCPKCSGELERAPLNAVDKCVAAIQDTFQDVCNIILKITNSEKIAINLKKDK